MLYYSVIGLMYDSRFCIKGYILFDGPFQETYFNCYLLFGLKPQQAADYNTDIFMAICCHQNTVNPPVYL